MSRKSKKKKNIHSDKYQNASSLHQAEVARDIARWEKQRQAATTPEAKDQAPNMVKK